MRIKAWIVPALVAGCIDQHGGAGGAGGSAGSTGTAGSSGTSGAAGMAGASGTAGTAGAGGTGAECRQRADSNAFGFGVKDPNGAELPFDSQNGGRFVLHGTVRTVDSTSFSVEGCGAIETMMTNAGGANGEGGAGGAGGTGDDCESELWTIEAVAPELVLPAEATMRVSVAYTTWCQPFSGCNEEMLVHRELADAESPLLAMRTSYNGGSTGAVFTPLEWPVALELVDLGCPFPAMPAGDQAVTWALRMTGRANPESSVLLRMGESGELSLDAASDERWLARNVNSFDRGGYDASTTLNFYLAKRL